MTFGEYQEKAKKTIEYPNVGDNYVYPTLGLAGEAGELANKIKKIERDHAGIVTDEVRAGIASELGDLLWYIAALSTELGMNLETVAEANIQKLALRQQHGTLRGTGDGR